MTFIGRAGLASAAAFILALGLAGPANAAPTEYVWEGPSVPIPDGPHTLGETNVELEITDAAHVGDLDVIVGITHGYVGELKINLYSPAGTRVQLFKWREATPPDGDNIFATFDDEAPTYIGDASAPYAGEFRPVQPLSLFQGEGISGTWRLQILDDGFNNLGYGSLDYFALRAVTHNPEPGSMALIGAGIAGMGYLRRRRRAKAKANKA